MDLHLKRLPSPSSSSSSFSPTYMASTLPILLTLSSLSTLSAAYTWKFASPPQQCSNLTVSLSGSGGVPPYRLLVLPNGPTPLSSGVEVRKILDVPFPDGASSVSFKLKYPAFSQLVAVVSIFLLLLFFSFSFIFFIFRSSDSCYVFGFGARLSMFRGLFLCIHTFNEPHHLWTPPSSTFYSLLPCFIRWFLCHLLHAPHSFPCSVNPLKSQNIFIISIRHSAYFLSLPGRLPLSHTPMMEREPQLAPELLTLRHFQLLSQRTFFDYEGVRRMMAKKFIFCCLSFIQTSFLVRLSSHAGKSFAHESSRAQLLLPDHLFLKCPTLS